MEVLNKLKHTLPKSALRTSCYCMVYLRNCLVIWEASFKTYLKHNIYTLQNRAVKIIGGGLWRLPRNSITYNSTIKRVVLSRIGQNKL